MNILCIGDVVGRIGCTHLRNRLPSLKKNRKIDLVIVNGENSADGNGITPESAEFLFSSGADVITTGNHCFRRREIYEQLEENPFLLRPANLSSSAPGKGYCLFDMGRIQVGIMNLIGTVYLEYAASPFETVDKLLHGEIPRILIVDFHGEATSEKRAMGFYLDGRVSAVFGTHTHVPTADVCILPKGTGYITDVGMTGPVHSVLGVKPEIVIRKMCTGMPERFILSDGPCRMDCVLFEVDEKTGKTISAEGLHI